MSYTIDDAALDLHEWDTGYDRLAKEVIEDYEGKKVEDLIKTIKDSYKISKILFSNLNNELILLSPTKNPQSVSFLTLSLLEAVERDLIFIPFFLSSINHEKGTRTYSIIKEALERKIKTSELVFAQFKLLNNDTDVDLKIIANLQNYPQSLIPDDHNLLWSYRAKSLWLRDKIAHGKSISNSDEAEYILRFTKTWREEILNSILKNYCLILDKNWELKYFHQNEDSKF